MSKNLEKALTNLLKEESKDINKIKPVNSIPPEISSGLEIWNEENIDASLATTGLPGEELDELKSKITELSKTLQFALSKIAWDKVDLETMPKLWYQGTDGWNMLSNVDTSVLEEYVQEVIDWAKEQEQAIPSEESIESEGLEESVLKENLKRYKIVTGSEAGKIFSGYETTIQNRKLVRDVSFLGKTYLIENVKLIENELEESNNPICYEESIGFKSGKKIAEIESTNVFSAEDFNILPLSILEDYAWSKGIEFTTKKQTIERLLESGKVSKEDMLKFYEIYKTEKVNKKIVEDIDTDLDDFESKYPAIIDFRYMGSGESIRYDDTTPEYKILNEMGPEDWENYIQELDKYNISVKYDSINDYFIIENIDTDLNDFESKYPAIIDFRYMESRGLGSTKYDNTTPEYKILNEMNSEDWRNYIRELAKYNISVEYDSINDCFIVKDISETKEIEEGGERYMIQDDDKQIVENIITNKKYKLIECRGAFKSTNKEHIMELIVEKDGHQTLIEYNDAAIIKPWRIKQNDFNLLQEALDSIYIPFKKLVNDTIEANRKVSKAPMILEKIQKQYSNRTTDLPLAEKERRLIRGAEITETLFGKPKEDKQELNESTYSDFLINYGTEIRKALLNIAKINKLIKIKKISRKDFNQALEKIEATYDEPVFNLIDKACTGFDSITGEEIAEVGMKIHDRFGTEPRQVLIAIQSFANDINEKIKAND
jgi:hypothetical protein